VSAKSRASADPAVIRPRQAAVRRMRRFISTLLQGQPCV
jgi:hypothetical protein